MDDEQEEEFVFFPLVNTVVLTRGGGGGLDLEEESRVLGPCLAMDSLGGFALRMPSSGSSVYHVN